MLILILIPPALMAYGKMSCVQHIYTYEELFSGVCLCSRYTYYLIITRVVISSWSECWCRSTCACAFVCARVFVEFPGGILSIADIWIDCDIPVCCHLHDVIQIEYWFRYKYTNILAPCMRNSTWNYFEMHPIEVARNCNSRKLPIIRWTIHLYRVFESPSSTHQRQFGAGLFV